MNIFLSFYKVFSMQKLAWPISYDHFNFRGKDYLFFGDYHKKPSFPCTGNVPCATIGPNGEKVNADSPCWNFDYFLTDLASRMVREKRYLDYFSEVAFYTELQPDIIITGTSYIVDVLNSYYISRCYMANKTLCPFYPYARFHYGDVRKFMYIDERKIEILNDPLITLINSGQLKNFKKFKEYFNLLINSQDFPRDFSNLTGYYDNTLIRFKVHPIQKQFSKLALEDPQLAIIMKQYIFDYLQRLILYSREKDNILYQNMNYPNISLISVLIMDSYILPRMFRKFDNPSRVAITYVGGAHAAFYSNFFSDYLQLRLLSDVRISAETVVEKSMDEGEDVVPQQCYRTPSLNSLFHLPPLKDSENIVDVIIDGVQRKSSREYIYGILMGSKDLFDTLSSPKVSVKIGPKYYSITKNNVHYVLKVGAENNSKSYITDGPYNRIYFNTSEFIRGYTTIKDMPKIYTVND